MNMNLQECYLIILKLTILVLILYPNIVSSGCTCEVEEDANQGQREATLAKYYKLGSIASILVAGGIGVSLPLLGKKIKALSPENDVFFMIKAFGGGVILATGFIHILPGAFDALTSPCLGQNPWANFPLTGLVAMMSGIGTLMVDSLATGFYKRNKQVNIDEDDEEAAADINDEHSGHVHVHSRASASSTASDSTSSELIRRRIIAQVLELGIVVHSMIIGISVGTSRSSETIKPLLVALSFHQFFEGLGLGGCISQAKLKSKSTAIMAIFFSLTTPVGIAIGMAISAGVYKDNKNRPTALAVEGVFDSASAGILIYMALVDILAADFMNPRLLSNFRILLGSNVALLLGAASMSLVAKWA